MSKSPSKGRSGGAGSPGGDANAPSLDGLSFENALEQVEAIIGRIEAGEVGLEESLTAYERGVHLINQCRSRLDAAQQQIEDLTRKLDAPQGRDDKGTPPREAQDGPDTEDEDPPF